MTTDPPDWHWGGSVVMMLHPPGVLDATFLETLSVFERFSALEEELLLVFLDDLEAEPFSAFLDDLEAEPFSAFLFLEPPPR